MTFNTNVTEKPIGIKNSGLTGGESAIITGELVFSAITKPTTMFTQSSKFDKEAAHYGVIISNPTFRTETPAMQAFLMSNVYQSKYNTQAITLNHAVQTGEIKVHDSIVRRDEGIQLERELGKQIVQVYVETYYSTKFNTPAMAVRAILIEDENHINYLQNSSFLSAFGLEPNPNLVPVKQQVPVETFENNVQEEIDSQLPFKQQVPVETFENNVQEEIDSQLPFKNNVSSVPQTKGLDLPQGENKYLNPFAR